jgi:hypothetical protein
LPQPAYVPTARFTATSRFGQPQINRLFRVNHMASQDSVLWNSNPMAV